VRTADWTGSTSVLDRITAVFDAFGEDDEGVGITELARRARLPKSTVSRIAAELVEQRLLDRDGDILYLGVRLFELGQAVEHPRRLRRLAHPVMDVVRSTTGQTVQLAVLDGPDVVFVAILRGQRTSEPIARVGSRRRADATALGQALLLKESDATGAAAREGTVIRRDESASGRMTSIARPVVGASGVPLAAIGVTGTDVELDVPRSVAAIREAATALGHRLSAGARR
jgi:DNA-binding IclR family transcriptional regulator